MYLYEKRLLALENEFEEIRLEIIGLSVKAEGSDESTDLKDLKTKLAFCTERIRLIKEQTAFYVKLGEKYDILRLLEDFTDAVRNEDAELEARIFNLVCDKWNAMMGGDDGTEIHSGTGTEQSSVETS